MRPSETISVEPLGSDILDQVACMLIDAQVFPAPSVELAIDLKRPSTTVLVARLPGGGRPLGFAAATRSRQEIYVSAVAVDPEVFRRGVGTALVRALIRTASLRRVGLRLHVGCRNAAAIALYAGLGFSTSRLRRAYYPGGGDAYEMVWSSPRLEG